MPPCSPKLCNMLSCGSLKPEKFVDNGLSPRLTFSELRKFMLTVTVPRFGSTHPILHHITKSAMLPRGLINTASSLVACVAKIVTRDALDALDLKPAPLYV